MNKSVALAGCGNMGFAMLKGWIDGKALNAADVTVIEPNEELRDRAASLGVATALSLSELDASFTPGLAVLAVKPQSMASVLPHYAPMASRGTAFLSVAAGVGMRAYEAALGERTAIVRCMPNTPAAIGKGMLVYYNNHNVSAPLEGFVRQLLACSGLVAKIDDEAQMDAVTAVSGSGPAYVFHFIECLTQAGLDAGLPEKVAEMLAMQTVMGAGALAAQSAETPSKLRENVTSPNGTTQAGLQVLMGGNALRHLVSTAVEAARRRSVELGA